MNRYRWYRLDRPGSHRSFVTSILGRKFQSGKSSGFFSIEDQTDKQGFRFAWETLIPKTSFGVSGSPSVELISSVSFCEFSLFEFDGTTWLRAVNPPRSLKELMNALEESIGFGFASELISFERAALPKSLSKLKDARLIGFKAIGVVPKPHAVARIEVAARDGLDLGSLNFLKHISYEIDHAVYEITFQRVRGQITLSSTGLVKISGQLAPLVLHLIETDLIAGNS